MHLVAFETPLAVSCFALCGILVSSLSKVDVKCVTHNTQTDSTLTKELLRFVSKHNQNGSTVGAQLLLTFIIIIQMWPYFIPGKQAGYRLVFRLLERLFSAWSSFHILSIVSGVGLARGAFMNNLPGENAQRKSSEALKCECV